jgi:hypothetical protein
MISPTDVERVTDVRRIDRLYACTCGWWGHRSDAVGAGVFGLLCPDCAGRVREFMWQEPAEWGRTDEQHADAKARAVERRAARAAKMRGKLPEVM